MLARYSRTAYSVSNMPARSPVEPARTNRTAAATQATRAYAVVVSMALMNVLTMHAQDRQPTAVPPQQARLVKLHPALDAIVSSETAIEKIYAGPGHLLEGPLWTRDGTLLFSDIAANVIYSLRREGI